MIEGSNLSFLGFSVGGGMLSDQLIIPVELRDKLRNAGCTKHVLLFLFILLIRLLLLCLLLFLLIVLLLLLFILLVLDSSSIFDVVAGLRQ